ncbi:PGPGW domain-containing protein [Cellulomonas chitinilytica]|uniref:PGPGW domain-containing protein n=1 Tax=Cellulomonas chitinilytica TaxID=398759 RepID=UPI0019417A9C|nr:PGPGW domain-containing protein [Cellulomonas chitinilytica]
MSQDSVADEIAAGDSSDNKLRRALDVWHTKLDTVPGGRAAFKVVVAVVGSATVLVGIALLVLPGPGWLVIFLGLGILSTEFAAARRLTDRLRAIVLRGWAWLRSRRSRPAEDPAAAPTD